MPHGRSDTLKAQSQHRVGAHYHEKGAKSGVSGTARWAHVLTPHCPVLTGANCGKAGGFQGDSIDHIGQRVRKRPFFHSYAHMLVYVQRNVRYTVARKNRYCTIQFKNRGKKSPQT